MTLAFEQGIDPISVTGCPPQVGLTPGATYLIDGLSQGTLGVFSVIAVALNATALSSSVKVFPTGAPANSNGWPGIIDWTTCQLSFLHDAVNNLIEGTANISNFEWFSSVAFDNYISADSVVTFGASWNGIFSGNRISGASNFTGTALPLGSSFSQNILVNTTTVSVNKGGGVGNIIGNSFLGGTDLNIVGGGTLTFTDNVVENNTVFVIQGNSNKVITNSAFNAGNISIPTTVSGSVTLNNVTVHTGAINLDNVKTSWQLLSSFIRPGGNLTAVANDPGSVTITNLRLQSQLAIAAVTGTLAITNVELFGPVLSVLAFNNTAGAHVVENIFAGPNSNLALSVTTVLTLQNIFLAHAGLLQNNTGTPSPGGLIIDIYVERGILDTNGFMAQRLRLQNEDSTLIANTADAIKSGYINALP